MVEQQFRPTQFAPCASEFGRVLPMRALSGPQGALDGFLSSREPVNGPISMLLFFVTLMVGERVSPSVSPLIHQDNSCAREAPGRD